MKAKKETIDIRIPISKELHNAIKHKVIDLDTTLQKLLPMLIQAGLAQMPQTTQAAQPETKAKPKGKSLIEKPASKAV